MPPFSSTGRIMGLKGWAGPNPQGASFQGWEWSRESDLGKQRLDSDSQHPDRVSWDVF